MAKLSSKQIAEQARDAQLDRIEGMLSQLARTYNADTIQDTWQRNVITLLVMMAEDRRIEAIKALRLMTGLPLKEAKDYVCNAISRQRP